MVFAFCLTLKAFKAWLNNSFLGHWKSFCVLCCESLSKLLPTDWISRSLVYFKNMKLLLLWGTAVYFFPFEKLRFVYSRGKRPCLSFWIGTEYNMHAYMQKAFVLTKKPAFHYSSMLNMHFDMLCKTATGTASTSVSYWEREQFWDSPGSRQPACYIIN